MKRILYFVSGVFGLCALLASLPPLFGEVSFFTLYLAVIPASWIYATGIESVLVRDIGHMPWLTPLGVALLYGVPCLCFFSAARRSKERSKEPIQAATDQRP